MQERIARLLPLGFVPKQQAFKFSIIECGSSLICRFFAIHTEYSSFSADRTKKVEKSLVPPTHQ
jgi:hypothetical protein